MKRLIMRRWNSFMNLLTGLRTDTVKTIKHILYLLFIRYVYRTFFWIFTVLIFGPAFFEDNIFTGFKKVFNWLGENFMWSYHHLTVKFQNLFNDLIRYVTNWDVPTIEKPIDRKPSPPVHEEPPVHKPKPELHKHHSARKPDEETFSRIKRMWDTRLGSRKEPESLLDSDTTRTVLYVIGGVLIITGAGIIIYQNWESISPVVVPASTWLWEHIRVMWRYNGDSPDDGATDGDSSNGNNLQDRPKMPDDVNRSYSQEELNTINPSRQFKVDSDAKLAKAEQARLDAETDASIRRFVWNSDNSLDTFFPLPEDVDTSGAGPSGTTHSPSSDSGSSTDTVTPTNSGDSRASGSDRTINSETVVLLTAASAKGRDWFGQSTESVTDHSYRPVEASLVPENGRISDIIINWDKSIETDDHRQYNRIVFVNEVLFQHPDDENVIARMDHRGRVYHITEEDRKLVLERIRKN